MEPIKSKTAQGTSSKTASASFKTTVNFANVNYVQLFLAHYVTKDNSIGSIIISDYLRTAGENNGNKSCHTLLAHDDVTITGSNGTQRLTPVIVEYKGNRHSFKGFHDLLDLNGQLFDRTGTNAVAPGEFDRNKFTANVIKNLEGSTHGRWKVKEVINADVAVDKIYCATTGESRSGNDNRTLLDKVALLYKVVRNADGTYSPVLKDAKVSTVTIGEGDSALVWEVGSSSNGRKSVRVKYDSVVLDGEDFINELGNKVTTAEVVKPEVVEDENKPAGDVDPNANAGA